MRDPRNRSPLGPRQRGWVLAFACHVLRKTRGIVVVDYHFVAASRLVVWYESVLCTRLLLRGTLHRRWGSLREEDLLRIVFKNIFLIILIQYQRHFFIPVIDYQLEEKVRRTHVMHLGEKGRRNAPVSRAGELAISAPQRKSDGKKSRQRAKASSRRARAAVCAFVNPPSVCAMAFQWRTSRNTFSVLR